MMRVLSAAASFEEEIKRSRFIARAVLVDQVEGIREQIEALSEAEANHNCWAWRFGEQYRFDDAGEPGGTAGRPILQAIDGHDLDRTLVVVARYFGGVKLGAGGLVRAYGGTASRCLDAASTRPLRVMLTVTLKVPFDSVSAVYTAMERCMAERQQEQYQADGAILAVRIAAAELSAFKSQVRDLTRGQANWIDEKKELAVD